MSEEKAMTQMVPALETALVEYVKSALAVKLKSGAKPIMQYREADVYEFGAPGSMSYLVLVEIDSGEILYFVRHKLIKANNKRFGRQVLVWRDKQAPQAAKFASYVFFEYLLPKYGALIADQEQTERGRAFWQYAIAHAMDIGEHVYFLDRRSTPNRLIPIESQRELKFYEPQMWGTTEGHRRTFAVISNKKLRLPE